MFGFRINEEFLDLEQNASLSLEVNNPLFNQDFEKGMLTYGVSAPLSDRNRRLLRFAGSLSIRSIGKRPLPCQMWLRGQLYRVGKLYVLGRTDKYKVQFVSDAGDLDTVTEDMLRGTDLSGVSMAYPKVLNPGFYSDEEAAFGYPGYMNGGGPQVPMPNLVEVFRKTMARYGYSISGQWLQDYANRVIYNPVLQGNPLQPQLHVPELKVAEFIKSIRKHYGLGFIFNGKSKSLQLVYLQEALQNTAYTDWTHLAQGTPAWDPNTSDGFTLQLQTDSDDERQKDAQAAYQYKYGNGAETINTGIGTTAMENGVPIVDQEGATYDDEPDFSFRVLVDNGNGTSSAETVEAVASRHLDWMAWHSETEPVTFNLNLGISELLQLDPLDKKLIRTPQGTLKAFWEKVQVSLNMTGEMKSKVRFLKVMQ
ncbi:hypothetical protein [uncultured Pontibacter sp.]|uniref:hypothetical protein n=1 Tax=uncultured Pontibacter sp. TaxID=453356 RepID=UPI0026386A3B|nr:hypothetical protein [uncultured Pontibacter sp.]